MRLARRFPLLGVLALLGGGAPAPELAFHPAEGSAVTKRFVEETSWSLVEMLQRVEGNPILGAPEVSARLRRQVTATDRYGATEEGRLAGLERTLDEAVLSVELDFLFQGRSESYAYDLESPFVDVPLAVAWDPGAGAYEVEAEDLSDPALLEGLDPRLDLAGLLPPEDAEVGDSWEVDPEALAAVLALGGDLAFVRSSLPDGDYVQVEPPDALAAAFSTVSAAAGGDVDGEVVATWEETTGDGGPRRALVRLAIDLELENDVTGHWRRLLEACGVDGTRAESELTTTCSLEGEGELVWDLRAGRFEELSLQGDFRTSYRMGWEMDTGEDVLGVEVDFVIEGTTSVTAAAEPR